MSDRKPGDNWTGDYTGRREKSDDSAPEQGVEPAADNPQEATGATKTEETGPIESSQSSEPVAQDAPAPAAVTGAETAETDQSARVAGAAAAAAMAAPGAPAEAASKPEKVKHSWYVRLVGGIIWLYEHLPNALIALLARVVIGLVFWTSARTKVENIFEIKSSTFFLFEEEYKMPITISFGDTQFTVPFTDPVTAAYITTIAEHLFPILLWIGFCTRFSATALLIMVCVIAFWVYPNEGLATWVLHGLWAVVLLYLMRWGPGAFSIDHLLRRRYMNK